MQGPIIYKSSAGSGKTYNLVSEYLRLVIPDPWRYKHILAITFTNKATEEMKSRIVQALFRLANLTEEQQEQDAQYQMLQQVLVQQGKEQLSVQQQAQKALSLILNDYGSFSVSTIESFMQRIIRSFTRELNIQLGYEIEMKQDVVLNSIVDAVLMEAGQKQTLTRLFQGFIDQKLEEEKSWHVEIDVKKLGRELFQEQFQELSIQSGEETDPLETTLSFDSRLWAIRKNFENGMRDISRKALALIQRYGLSVEDFFRKSSGPAGYLYRIGQAGKVDRYKPNSYAMQAYHQPEKWYTKSAAAPLRAQIEAVVANGLGDLLAEAIHLYESQSMAYTSAIEVHKTLYSFGLIHELEKQLKHYRRENNLLLISDTNFLLGSIIRGQEDAPFIFEKVGTRYQYYLLDEFQDTSNMQWENLFPLIADALAQGTGALMVGDVKQSIYRWRNGNMRLLMDGAEKRLLELGQSIQLQHLTHNWRTAKAVVAFNNQFFRRASQALSQQFEQEDHEQIFIRAYETVEQQAQKSNIEGYVRIEAFPGRKPKDPPETPSWQELAMQRCLEIINELKADGFEGKDIMLLVRRNREGIAIAEYLQQHEVKVNSAESLLVASHPGVQLLTAALKHLQNESNPVAAAAVRYYHARMQQQRQIDHQVFGHTQKIVEHFDAQKDALRKLPLYACVQRLQHIFPKLAEPNAYVQGFLEAVHSYCSSQDTSISGFLDWWEAEKQTRAIAGTSDPDAVQIMTIHKAKGLEFPVVILPFAEWNMPPDSRDIIWVKSPRLSPYQAFEYIPLQPSGKLEETYFRHEYQQELIMSYLDNLNLLYVAFTRPQYRLYVLTKAQEPPKNGIKSISHLLATVATPRQLNGNFLQEAPLLFETGSPHKISPKPTEGADIAGKQVFTLSEHPQTDIDLNQVVGIRYSSNRFVKSDILTRQERITAGELLHEALAHLRTPQELEPALEKLLHKGYLTPQQLPTLKAQLRQVVSHPLAAGWYDGSWEVRNECEIITHRGEVLRPDRIMLKDQLALVVDYKSGQENPRHHRQVKGYMQALKEMGYSTVKGYVYYIRSGEIVEVQL